MAIATITHDTLTTLTCLKNADVEDDLIKQIKGDLEDKGSILEMMKEYMKDLKGEKDNNALPYRKLQRLFEIGITPQRLEGHHYGVTVGLRTGDLQGAAAEYGNIVGYIWGMAIGDVCPWVGKSFGVMTAADRKTVVKNAVPDNIPVYRGINHFNVIEHAPVNIAANSLLTFMWHLQESPAAERNRYGHERNGGHFASYRSRSIYDKTPREVFTLNYRYKELNNFPPLTLLIDELVEIADGLYLGQLLFATARLLEKYDPDARIESYRYRHFGYFLLFREDWNVEAKRLFPHLEMPEAAVTTRVSSEGRAGAALSAIQDKFKTLTLNEPLSKNADPRIIDEVKKDIAVSGSIIHMLKNYSDTLHKNPDPDSPVFAKLNNLFYAGIPPVAMDGFFRGALVAWHEQDFFAKLDIPALNITWQATRMLSPWTGKRFDPIDKARLLQLTDNFEKMDVPTFFCANTVVFRTVKEKITRRLMQAVNAWIEDATEEEKRLYGYGAKSFFFIGRTAKSVLAENNGMTVFQFNYRWKALRTPPPDFLCIDEIVRIAQGLYLGQLLYATDVIKPWSPVTDPEEYKYRLFGYFLLMDEEWHSRRLRIGFDLDNV